ncbi:hypothetical protein [Xanthobacter sp. 126]|uniref:hypothetical protein n=1 Tax=Xanthobacter sp. 126 TaxID=1131814 RepID=UPI0004B59EF1|nr:hypothetical protein [Xanthobacter sp. 126]
MYFFEHGNVNGTIIGSGGRWMIFFSKPIGMMHDGRVFPSSAAALAEVRAAS